MARATRGNRRGWAAAFSLAAVAWGLVVSPAAATHLVNGSVTASSNVGGAENVTFTISGAVGGGNPSTIEDEGSLVVTFPSGFDVSGATFVSGQICTGGDPSNCRSTGSNFVIDGQQLQLLNLPGILAVSDTFEATFAGITNAPGTGAPAWDDQSLADFIADSPYDDGVSASNTPVNTSFLIQLFRQGPGSAISTSGAVSFPLVDHSDPPTYAVTAGALPTGVSLDGTTGAITGTPTVGGESYSFTITATNDSGSVTASFSGTVLAALAWSDDTLGPIVIGVPYVDGVTAVGEPPATYAITAGVLPAGLALDGATGAITGTATETEDYSFTITATNSLGSISLDFEGSTGAVPAWIDDQLAPIVAGLPYEDGVSASGAPAPTYAVTAGALPAGLALDEATGAIFGTPTANADYDFTITASNQAGAVSLRFTGTTTRPDPTANPEVLGVLTAQAEASRRFLGTQISNVRDRQRQVRTSGHNASSNDLQLSYEVAGVDVGAAAMPLAGHFATTGDTRVGEWGLWTGGTVVIGRSRETSSAAGSRFRTTGITIGADRRLGESWLIGIAGGYGREGTDVGAMGSKVDGRHRAVAAYATWAENDYFVDMMAGLGRVRFDNRRWSEEAGVLARGQRSGNQVFAAVTAGREFVIEGFELAPRAHVEAGRTRLRSYQESGAGAFDLSYAHQTVRSLVFAVGFDGGYPVAFGGGRVRPHVLAEYQRDQSSDGRAGINYVTFPVASDYRVRLGRVTRNNWLVGAGVDVDLDGGLSLKAQARHRIAAGGRNASQFLASLAWRF